MPKEYMYIMTALLLLVCLALIVYINSKYQQIKLARTALEVQKKKIIDRHQEQRDYLIESITVIAKAYGSDDRLTCAEACIRLSTLLQSLSPGLLDNPDLSVIREVHRKTEHIPIKGKWKALSKQERWRYSKEMAAIEAEHEKDALAATEYLANYDFNLIVN